MRTTARDLSHMLFGWAINGEGSISIRKSAIRRFVNGRIHEFQPS